MNGRILNKNMILLCIVTFILWFCQYIYMPYFSNYLSSISPDYQFVGIILGAYGAIQLFTRLPIGIFSDKINRQKPFVTAGLLFCVLSGIGLYFFRTPYYALISRAFAGIGVSVWSVYIVLYLNSSSGPNSSNDIGILNSLMFSGQATAQLLGGFIITLWTIQINFLLCIIIGSVGVIASFFIKDVPTKKEHKLNLADVFTVLKDKNLLFYSSVYSIVQLLNFATVFGFTSIILEQNGASKLLIGISTMMYTLPSVLSSAIAGSVFAKKFGIKPSMVFCYVFFSITVLLQVIVKNPIAILILIGFGGFIRGILATLTNSMAIATVDPSLRSTGVATYQAIYSIGMFVGPFISGFILNYFGMTICFVALFLFGMVGAVSTYFKKLY